MKNDNDNFDDLLEEIDFADEVRYLEADRPDWTLVSEDDKPEGCPECNGE